MFRKMRRCKQQVSEAECIHILKDEKRGVLSLLGDDDYPYGVPVNYWYDETRSCIYIHGAKTGHKMDALARHDKVSFCVWNQGFQKEGDWAWNITSVIAFGRVKVLEDPDRIRETLLALGGKYYPSMDDVHEELKKAGARAAVLEVKVEHLTGKLVNES